MEQSKKSMNIVTISESRCNSVPVEGELLILDNSYQLIIQPPSHV